MGTLECIRSALDEHNELLWAVNQKIFSTPELALEEYTAHDTLVAALSRLPDVRVTPHAYGLATAFEAEFGVGGRLVVCNAEYDALPGIGHGCGHNLIATLGLGAFLGAAAALRQCGRPGRVRLLGTPAEEAHGGKIQLLTAGAYDAVDACLMMHPTAAAHYPDGVSGDAFDRTLAIAGFEVVFSGRAAHAALAPWEGINALDAAVSAYTAVAALRQHIRPNERIQGYMAEGGMAVNVVPDRTRLVYAVRAPTLAAALALQARVLRCFDGAAMSSGCTATTTLLGSYADLRANLPICRAFQSAMADLGHMTQCNVDRAATPASTDQGNVSYACPSWHGIFGIPSDGAYPHTAGFTTGAGKRAAFDRALQNSEGMAHVAFRLLTDDVLVAEVQQAFAADKFARDDSKTTV